MAGNKNKKGRNLLLLLLLMVVMIGAIIWITKYKDQQESSNVETEEDSLVITTMDTSQISTIHFEMPDNEMTLILNEEGTWLNYLDENFPLNQTYAGNMSSAFASISATRTIREENLELSEFGLKEPAAVISATLKDGTATLIKIGSKVPVTGGYYATLNDDGKVYVISESFYNAFNYNLMEMTVVETIPSITAENIMSLSIKNQDKPSFEVVYEEDSPADLSGFSNYIINKPYPTPVPADTDAITTLFANYTAMSFTSCVEYNATDLSIYGLDNPSSSIHITYYEELTQDADTDDREGSDESEEKAQSVTKVNHELTLYLGGTDENGDYYAKVSNSKAVHTISASTVATLTEIDPYENSYQYINLINLDGVNSVTLLVDGNTYELRIDRATKTVEGEETEVSTYYLNDKEMEEEAFKGLYQVIIGTVTDRLIPEEKGASSTTPYMRVTYELVNEEEPLVISYLPYDQNYYVVNTNGVEYFLADMRKVDEIYDSLLEAQ